MLNFFKKNKNIIVPSFVLFVICIVIPFALAFTNNITKDKIASLDEENRNKAMAALIKADKYDLKEKPEFSYYEAVKKDETVGFIFTVNTKGYGGEVSVMTAVNPDGTVKAVSILDVSGETPGLGQNAAKENFYGQYSGKKSGISLLKSEPDPKKNEVKAVTGATITSTAVNRAVNTALDRFDLIKEGKEDAEK